MSTTTTKPSLPAAAAAAAAAGAIRVAVASDDSEALQAWSQGLATEGIVIERLSAPRSAPLRLADVVVLHLQSGLGCQLPRLRELREQVPLSPLVIWCKGLRDLDHVLALEMGVDDVLDAATSPMVLGARLRALWRRCSRGAANGAGSDELRFGRLSVQLHARRVVLGAAEVQLTESEFDVLWLLASRAGTPVSRQELLRQMRGLDLAPHDRSIDSRVYRLRNKLRDGDSALQRIRTVRNRGYVFSPLGW